jgi:asparagine synthetase B (glutamine-hydrolysing)
VFKDGRVTTGRYWRIEEIEPHGVLDRVRLDDLEQRFDLAVRRSLAPEPKPLVMLTGGLDSRAIIASAARQGMPLRTLTIGDPESRDARLAEAVAHLVGSQHTFEPVSLDRATGWLDLMVRCQGGIVATLHSYVCQILNQPGPYPPAVHGVGGEYARGFWRPPSSPALLDPPRAADYLYGRMLGGRRGYFAEIWRPEAYELADAPRAALLQRLDGYAGTASGADRMHYIYLQDRCRTFINKGIIVDRNAREVHMPYLDHDWIEAVAALPAQERLDQRIQVELIRRACPALLDVPYAKDLIPLSTPHWLRKATHTKRRVLKRLKRSLGANVSRDEDVHFSRGWSRNSLRPALEDLLYDPNATFRDYLRWDRVQPLLDHHFAGQHDVDSLLGALTVLEVAHRAWTPAPATVAP